MIFSPTMTNGGWYFVQIYTKDNLLQVISGIKVGLYDVDLFATQVQA